MKAVERIMVYLTRGIGLLTMLLGMSTDTEDNPKAALTLVIIGMVLIVASVWGRNNEEDY